ncbi:coiled-coil domain-containing protein 124-like [Gigantopelta aegis]|uniref:coiled-coil domain-containing protein 124-like n=1 Tax=Gigantopelta aegis TaxID=1735272 RepID=UPI001B88DF7A|nr:coiled-coil domain-containing protein 124-like [Gigantopelta aegis]XP_041361088.1 coiled-coil domain-containing protein 124-like [Gigantopelta aegis]
MPKKFKGENSKAVEARARKDAQKIAEQERIQKEKEDALWVDEDKHVARKQQRKDEREKKRIEQLEKKKELQKLHDEEMDALKGAKSKEGSNKLTRADIDALHERQQAELAAKTTVPVHDELPLVENVNRLQVDGEVAQNVEEAISLLSVQDPALDKHPEKRVKAAYTKFEETNLPVLKRENPNMRLSQLKQQLKKEWMKSPENPLNQRYASFNSK